MRCADERRRQLMMQKRRSESRRLAETNWTTLKLTNWTTMMLINWTTLMLLVVVGVFLIVEFPLAFLFIILIVQITLDIESVKTSSSELVKTVISEPDLFTAVYSNGKTSTHRPEHVRADSVWSSL